MAGRPHKTILITGGSRGIGRSVALCAGALGWSAALGYRADAAMAERTVDEVRAKGGKALAVRGEADVEADVRQLFDTAEEAFGRIDAVIVNAGTVGPSCTLAEMTADRIKRVLDVNLFGAILCAREAARRLARPMNEPSASIVFVSSTSARLGAAFEFVDYAATKGALDTLTVGLSKELGAQNIRVNAVRPGLIDTEIHAVAGQPDRAARLGAGAPLQRAGTTEEVAEAIMHLCSDAASYTTGALLDVSGGR